MLADMLFPPATKSRAGSRSLNQQTGQTPLFALRFRHNPTMPPVSGLIAVLFAPMRRGSD